MVSAAAMDRRSHRQRPSHRNPGAIHITCGLGVQHHLEVPDLEKQADERHWLASAHGLRMAQQWLIDPRLDWASDLFAAADTR